MSIVTFIINLDKNKDRWDSINKELSKTDLKCYRFPATWGKDITINEEEKYLKGSKFSRSFMTDFIKGCAISHLKVLKYFLKTNLDYILVLEDDASIVDNITKKNISNTIKDIVSKHKNFDVIRLYHTKILFGNYSNLAYLVSRKGAKKILKNGCNYHIDVTYNNIKNLDIIDYKPMIFTDKGTFVSDNNGISSNNKLKWCLNMDVFKMPIINVGIKVIYLIFFIIIILLLILCGIIKPKKKKISNNIYNKDG